MDATNEAVPPQTPAAAQGLTLELGRAIARIAARELAAGRLDDAQRILEGLAITNPHDPAAWTLLAVAAKRRARPLAARAFATVASRLAPRDPQVRLVRAEILLSDPGERATAREELEALARTGGAVSARSRAVLTALGR